MKSRSTCLYIILITWGAVYCEMDYAHDEVSDVDFPKNSEDTELVDPHSFNYDRNNKKMRDRQAVRFARSDDICISDSECRKELKQCRDALDSIEFNRLYTTRLINLLLSSAKLQEDGDLLTGSITLSGTRAQIDELRRFNDGKVTMQQVDSILSEIITPTMNIFAETLTLIEHLHIKIQQHRNICIAFLVTLAVLLLIKYVNWSTGRVVTVFLAGVFFISFFTTWSQLIKEAELKHLVAAIKYKNPPIQCDPEKLNIWTRFITSFDGNDQCLEYYKAIEFDAFHEVTAVDALFEVLDIGSRLGSVIGRFIENITEPLPFFLRWPVTILLYIGGVVSFTFLIFALCGGHIRLWGPLCGMSIGGGYADREQHRLSSIQQRQPSLTEQRTPIDHITPGNIEWSADGESRHRVPTTITQTTNSNQSAIGAGDSRIQDQQTKPENSGNVCNTCRCKNSAHEWLDHAAIRAGDSRIQNQETKPENSGICNMCRCKDSVNKWNDDSAIGAGSSRIQNLEVELENSGIVRNTCCCKNRLNKSHVEVNEDTVNKPTESGARSKEKGDGDC